MSPLPPITGLASMPFMPSGPIGAADGANQATQAAGGAAAGDTGFAGALSSAIKGLNTEMVGSEHLSEQAATGQLADPTVALVAVEKADLAFNTAVQVRNKLVEGWQELSRMQV
ncbi:MAG: flagellar hook-basal body complex protein FliE [Thermoleophilia bacterium]